MYALQCTIYLTSGWHWLLCVFHLFLVTEIKIMTCAIDQGLNEQKYIVPGLGDYGDRFYATAWLQLTITITMKKTSFAGSKSDFMALKMFVHCSVLICCAYQWTNSIYVRQFKIKRCFSLFKPYHKTELGIYENMQRKNTKMHESTNEHRDTHLLWVLPNLGDRSIASLRNDIQKAHVSTWAHWENPNLTDQSEVFICQKKAAMLITNSNSA